MDVTRKPGGKAAPPQRQSPMGMGMLQKIVMPEDKPGAPLVNRRGDKKAAC